MNLLQILSLSANKDKQEILKSLDLSVKQGDVHIIMGPNGSGKSTFAKVLMGYPGYTVTKGKILFQGKDMTTMSPDKRALAGLFLSFQSPQTIKGLSLFHFLRTIYNTAHAGKISVFAFKTLLEKQIKKLDIFFDLDKRYVNEGFSGGEMKKMEILQMNLLQPKLAILDEIDSGLDVDALKVVCKNIREHQKKRDMSIILITHQTKILKYIVPDMVHVITDGTIIASGDKTLAKEIDKKGYCAVCREIRNGKLGNVEF